MKEIKEFKMGDQIPEAAKFIEGVCFERGDYSFFYEVKIKTESSAPKINAEAIITDVIAYLNESTGKNFKPIGKNAQLIRDRIKTDKASTEDFLRCIDNMVAAWGDDSKMKVYLRPATLFQASKFDGYVNHKSGAQEAADAFQDLENYIND